MARNGLDTITGIFAHHDIVEDLTAQRCKRYLQSDNVAHLPQGEELYVHVAECIRQVEGAKLERGGWLGGDAWFGSVPCAVELMKRCGVFSTFIVKQHIQYFLKEVLHAVLLARFGERPAGHWVVMVGEISGVQVMALAYAWSMTSITYIVSTCGKTIQHAVSYTTKYEDSYGEVSSKERYPFPQLPIYCLNFSRQLTSTTNNAKAC